MNPVISLWKETWFVWLLFIALLGVAVYWVTPLFLVGFPAILFYFIYFAFIRYDEQGKKKTNS